MTTQGQGHSLTFVQCHSDSTLSNFCSSETARPIEANDVTWSLNGMWGMKICSNDPGHMTLLMNGKTLQNSFSLESRGRWLWNLMYSIRYSSTTIVFQNDDPGLTLPIFMTGSNWLLHGWKLIQHWVLKYFRVYSINSAYPQHSGERYRTISPLVLLDIL